MRMYMHAVVEMLLGGLGLVVPRLAIFKVAAASARLVDHLVDGAVPVVRSVLGLQRRRGRLHHAQVVGVVWVMIIQMKELGLSFGLKWLDIKF